MLSILVFPQVSRNLVFPFLHYVEILWGRGLSVDFRDNLQHEDAIFRKFGLGARLACQTTKKDLVPIELACHQHS